VPLQHHDQPTIMNLTPQMESNQNHGAVDPDICSSNVLADKSRAPGTEADLLKESGKN